MPRRTEQGSALVYILIAIALLAALTISFMNPSSQQTQSQNTFKVISELQSQVSFIRSAVQECILTYPGGDDGTLPPNPLIQENQPYPLNPSASYFDNNCAPAGDGSAANDNVEHMRCPGNPGDNACHADIFGGSSQKFLPPSPSLFNDWKWYNGPDGVFFWIDTDKTDPFIETVMTKLNESFSTCEADYINAADGGGEEFLDTANSISCASGSQCFRVWMVTDNESTIDTEESVYPDEPGCE